MQNRGRCGSNGWWLFSPSSSITTISPGSTSRRNSAPMMSSAQVSDDRTQPSPSRPITSGRTPSGSRTPISFERVIATTENAPSTRRSASFMRSGMSRCSDRAIRWMMHSESDDDWKIDPRSISSRRSATALVMLPLCAIAAPPIENSPKNGCTSRICVLPFDPAVE